MRIFILFLLAVFFTSCIKDDPIYYPKPKAYPRLYLPEHSYQSFKNNPCPCEFEYPTYATIDRNISFFEEKISDPCWFNINLDTINAKIYFTFKKIDDKKMFAKLLEDNHKLSYEHVKKADFIEENEFHTANNVHGILFDVGGNAASNYQFFLTDSSRYYMRGALYFNARPNRDSLEPIIKFAYKDLYRFIHSFKWEPK